MKTGILQNVLVHPFPIQLIYSIFIRIQTKGKTLAASYKDTYYENKSRTIRRIRNR